MKDWKDSIVSCLNHKCQTRSFKRAWIISSAVIVVLMAMLIVTIAKTNLMQNTEERTLSELQSTVKMQASAFEDQLAEQYQPLRLIADMLANGRHFTSEKIQPSLNSIVDTFNLRTLALVGTDGNAIKCIGEDIGNISNRSCFRQTMNGGKSAYCEYIESNKSDPDSRVMFALPAYDLAGNFLGVLVGCKDIKVLENSIFAQSSLFNSSSGIVIGDDSGELFSMNKSAYRYIGKSSPGKENEVNDEWTKRLRKMKSTETKVMTIDDTKYFVACNVTTVNSWKIYSIIDEKNAARTNSENSIRTKSTILYIIAILMLLIAYVITLSWINLKREKREASIIKQYNNNLRNILRETHCAVVEYDVKTEKIVTIQENFGNLNLKLLNGSMAEYEKYKHGHPEFDFEELENEIEIAKEKGKTCSFETILAPNSDSFYWLRTKLIPILNENGELVRVYCVLFDVSDLHKDHETAWDTYSQVPGAVYRQILSEPLHVNYYSDGLCKMLGYTRDEIDEMIGENHLYSLLVYEEDRPQFKTFLRNLSKEGGTASCEYRMIRKNGDVFSVIDTMDAKWSSSGIMYGYSMVIDANKYQEEQQRLEQELVQTKDQLSQSRLKNAGSQMQPHFLYNALSSIREIVLEDPLYAADLIYDFTIHLRACIRSMSNDKLVPFSQELENIRAYVNIEKMRFGDRLSVEYDCPEMDFDIIPLSIQPLVENAVRHGIFDRGKVGGTVFIRTARRDDKVLVVVEDTGTGFDFEEIMEEVEQDERDSSGLVNLIFRFETLMNAEVSVESKINVGTIITVAIPAEDGRKEGEE